VRIIINSRIDLSKWNHQQLWHGFISVELWTPYGCNDSIDDTSILNSAKSVNVIDIINSAPPCKRNHGNRHYTCQWKRKKEAVWPWSYGSWIYNYLYNQCLSPLMLWVRISIRARCTTLCDKVCQWLATGRWFSPGPPVSSTNKTDRHDITEILLKVALNTIKQTNERGKNPHKL
jgi:hypothetical protein